MPVDQEVAIRRAELLAEREQLLADIKAAEAEKSRLVIKKEVASRFKRGSSRLKGGSAVETLSGVAG